MVADRIESTVNPRVKALAKLKQARERERTGLFLIEGEREVERALAAAVAIETLLVCAELRGATHLKLPPGADLLELAEAPMGKIAVRQNPPGVIAVARQFDTGLPSLPAQPMPLVLVAEGVEKPGNLGAMLRTADAVGATAVVAAGAGTDIFNPNVVRASQGALFSVPVAVATTDEAISWINRLGLTVVGGYPAAKKELWEVRMDRPVAVLVGAEDIGISAAWDDVVEPVRIPMAGAADSLNASVAAAILLFEAARQRRSG